MSDVVHNTNIEDELSVTSDTIPLLGNSIQDIMRELKRAVEAQAGTLHQLTEAHTQLDNTDATSESFKAVIEIITALARQCADSDGRVHERFRALDTAINSLIDKAESVEKRLTLIANLDAKVKAVVADSQQTSATIADLSAQLHHLQTNLVSWQTVSSNEALQDKLEALTARVLLLETRTECLGELKSDARRSKSTLSAMAEDVESLLGQLAAVSKHVNTTATRLDAFRRYFEQIPD